MFHRLITLPAGRVGKWLFLLAWLIVAVVVGPVAGKLADVQRNEAAAWLPNSAESTEVVRLQDDFAGATLSAVVIYHRDGGVTAQDQTSAEADRATLAQRYAGGIPLQRSPDGAAIMFGLEVPSPTGTSGETALQDTVDDIRDTVGSGGSGLTVKVTGPAASLADMSGAYSNLDQTIAMLSVIVVAALLLFTYRSPLLWLFPLLIVIFASEVSTGSVYGLVKAFDLTVNSLAAGILVVLVFGAGTDYALLLVARYREELRRHADRHDAMKAALRGAVPAIAASAGTIAVGLLCLLAADMNTNRSLGPVAAVAVVCAFVAMCTLLPAVLVIFGRWIFWPFVPRVGSAAHEKKGLWHRVGDNIAKRPRTVWLITAVVLGVLATGLVDTNLGLSQQDQFRGRPDSVQGQELLAASFPSGSAQPAMVVSNAAQADEVLVAVRQTPGVANAQAVGLSTDKEHAAILATLTADPDSDAEHATIDRLRDRVHAVPGADAVVGGQSAENLDLLRASSRDNYVVIPLVLVAVLLILVLLLRALTAPLVLMATVILSFAAALGASAFIFDRIFGFAGMDAALPLQAFVFLVALGVDYNIFLATRIREETAVHGAHQGVLRGLSLTGGVITSAGLVLAATFAVLTVPPMVTLTELGFVVAFGVLLDTLVVRSVLVPAIALDLDRRFWWPSRLAARTPERSPAEAPTLATADER